MKRFILTITTIFICTIAYAHTINWHVGDTILETTTCDSGESITPPTAPYKYGYHFVHWDGYTPIEYLESTGTQYIDTGIVGNQSTEAEIEVVDCKYIPFMATNGSWANKNFGINIDISNKRFLFYMNCDGYTDYKFSANQDNISGNIKLLRTGIYLDDVKLGITKGAIPSPSSFTTTYPIFLFAINQSGPVWSAVCKIKYFKLWNNDIPVRDFIPVLDGEGVPCMYDKVEHKFYYNQGTGQFIAGPVISEQP